MVKISTVFANDIIRNFQFPNLEKKMKKKLCEEKIENPTKYSGIIDFQHRFFKFN